MNHASADPAWSRLAVLIIACASLGLPAADCNQPGDPVSETVLTILAKSPGSTFVFPNICGAEEIYTRDVIRALGDAGNVARRQF